MSKILEFINGLEIKTIFNIGFIIALVVAGLYIRQLWHDKWGLNAKIDVYENQLEAQDKLIEDAGKMIDELDKKNIKLTKKIKGYNKKYDSIKKGSNMDDAIKLYNSSK